MARPITPTPSVRASLAANILILIPVCSVLVALGESEVAVFAWGPPTAGRGILLSIYAAILAVSAALLFLHVRCADSAAVEHMVAALLITQVVYKVTTPATVGWGNPVVVCNLAVCALHAHTLTWLWRRHGGLLRLR